MKAILLAAAMVLATTAAQAGPGNASPPGNPNPGGHAYGIRGKGTAPAPLLGAGLPLLALGGGVILLARLRRKERMV